MAAEITASALEDGAEAPRSWRIELLIASVLALTGLAHFLFFRHSIGWTAGLFIAILTLVCIAVEPSRARSRRVFALVVLLFGLAAACVEEPSVLACFLAFGFLIALLLENTPLKIRGFGRFLKIATGFPFLGIGLAFWDANNLKNGLSKRAGLAFLAKWIVPLAFAGVFVILFADANPLVEAWLPKVRFDLRFDWNRIFFWFFAFGFMWALLRLPEFLIGNLQGIREPGRSASAQQSPVVEFLFSRDTILRSLILFNLVFLIENTLDAAFLWGGAALPKGMTYAKYAHEGAYPLIGTALLAAAFVLIALRPSSKAKSSLIIRILIAVWLFQNIFLVFSSLFRLNAYVIEYSLTYQRVAAFVWMGLVAVGLGLILVRLWRRKSNDWLIGANAISLVAVLYVSCFVDFGAIIARYNFNHSREVTGSGPLLDLGYLRYHIGLSALPVIRDYRLRFGYQSVMEEYCVSNDNSSLTVPCDAKLTDKYMYGQLWERENEWRAWTWRIHRLRKKLGREPFQVQVSP